MYVNASILFSILEDVNDRNGREYLVGHDAPISQMLVSRNGSICITGQMGSIEKPNRDSPVFVWDLPRRRLLWEFRGLAGKVLSLDLSRDNRFVLAVGLNDLLIVFDVETGDTVASKRLAVSESTKCVFASIPEQDVHKFAVITESAILSFTLSFDVRTLSYLLSPPETIKTIGGLSRKPVRVVALSDGGGIVIANQSGDLSLYNLAHNQFIGTITLGAPVLDIDRCPDDSLLVLCQETATNTRRSFVRKVNVHQKTVIPVVTPTADIVSLRATPNDVNHFLYETRDGNIHSSDTHDLVTHTIRSKAVGIQTVSTGTESLLLVNTSDAYECWIITESLCRESRVNFPSKFGSCVSIDAIHHSNESTFIVCGFDSGAVTVYRDGCLYSKTDLAHRGPVGSVGISLKYSVTGGKDDSTFRIWSLTTTPQLVFQCTPSLCSITCIRPDKWNERKIYFANDKREIFGFDLDSEKVFFKQSCVKFGDIADIEIAQISNNEYLDTVILSVHKCGRVSVWDPYFATPIATRELGDNMECLAVTSKTNPVVITASRQGKIHLLSTEEKLSELKVFQHPIVSQNTAKLTATKIIETNGEPLIVTLDEFGTITLLST